MKPTNIYKHGCDPISSNCVIWQGPDIDCINLCKGDNISTVVYNLATELCTLMDTFKITNYDLSCLNLLPCEPKDFQSLIQLLIDKVCTCCDVTPVPDPGTGTLGCPDCEVPICSVFYYTNPQGDTVTSMQLTDYVQAIGNKVCSIVSQIATINLTLDNHENRIQALEGGSSGGGSGGTTLPTVTPCSEINLPPEQAQLDVALQQLMDQYCTFVNIVGKPLDIYASLAFQCTGLSVLPQLANPASNMNTITGWESAPSTLEDSFRNMWLTICDMRTAIVNLNNNCCDTGCDTVVITAVAQRNATTSSTIEIIFSGTIPSMYQDCAGGSSITITDSAGGTVTYANQLVVAAVGNPAGLSFPLASAPGINPSLQLTVTTTACAEAPSLGTTCQNVIISTVGPEGLCPTLQINVATINTNSSADWVITNSIPTSNLPLTYELNVYDQAGLVLIQQQTINVTTSYASQTGTITGLTQNQTYQFFLQLTGGTYSPCPAVTFLVPGGPCEPCEIGQITITENPA